MVREALIRELAARFLGILREVEGADKLSTSDLIRVISIALSQFRLHRETCKECQEKPSDPKPFDPEPPAESES